MTGPFGEQVVPPTLSFWEGSNVTSSQLSGQDLPVAKSVQDRTLHLPPQSHARGPSSLVGDRVEQAVSRLWLGCSGKACLLAPGEGGREEKGGDT